MNATQAANTIQRRLHKTRLLLEQVDQRIKLKGEKLARKQRSVKSAQEAAKAIQTRIDQLQKQRGEIKARLDSDAKEAAELAEAAKAKGGQA